MNKVTFHYICQLYTEDKNKEQKKKLGGDKGNVKTNVVSGRTSLGFKVFE